MSKLFTFIAENKVPFVARRVDKMETYGLDDCLTHCESEPLIEFYDARYPHSSHGQFVSRYYLSTLQQHGTSGLCLDGGNADHWSIDAASLQVVLNNLATVQS